MRGAEERLPSVDLAYGEAVITDEGQFIVGLQNGEKAIINPKDIAAATAKKLAALRNFSASGDATAPAVGFDGDKDLNLVLTLANSGVIAGTYPKVTVDVKGRVTGGSALTAADIPALTLSKITDAGTAAGKNAGTASGNVPVLGSNAKLDPSVLPAIAVTDTFPVGNQAAMLALTAERGDIAIRTDLSKSFILVTEPASVLANWQEFLTPASPVQSVNGMTGAVTVTTISGNAGSATKLAATKNINDIPFDGSKDITIVDSTKEPKITASTADTYWNGVKTFANFAESVRNAVLTGLSTALNAAVTAADSVLVAIGKLQAQINARAPLASPALTGAPTAPTAAPQTNNTQIATTAFVKSQGYLDEDSVIDGGTF